MLPHVRAHVSRGLQRHLHYCLQALVTSRLPKSMHLLLPAGFHLQLHAIVPDILPARLALRLPYQVTGGFTPPASS
jgi:hypothetical protein